MVEKKIKKNININFLQALFVGLLVMSNVLSSKIIAIGQYVIPGGIFCYAITFLIMHIINEIFGEKQAKSTMIYGIFVQIICTLLLQIVIIMPGVNNDFNNVLSINIWLTIAGLISYLVSQFIGIKIFNKIKSITRKKWIYENVSTITSQIIDSLIFVGFGFGIGLGMSLNALLTMFVCQVITKVIIALVDTPFFYLIMHIHNKQGERYE